MGEQQRRGIGDVKKATKMQKRSEDGNFALKSDDVRVELAGGKPADGLADGNLTPEQKALQLQAKLREKRAEADKVAERERERARIKSGKMLRESDEKRCEEERLRSIERTKREKEEHRAERAELKEKLRMDYIERFGQEPPPEQDNELVASEINQGK